MINPKVSVVVPVYKVEPYIEKCCRSLFEQTLNEIEYIFVDDNSPDNSITIINQVLEEYPWRKEHVRFIRHSVNMGVAQSREDGNWEATGEYIIHCDGDDWVDHKAYEKMYRHGKENNAEIVICNYYTVFNDRLKASNYSIKYENRENLNFGTQPFFGAVWNKLIHRDLYIRNNIHVFEGINMSEDLGLTLRLRYFSKKTIFIQEPLYFHLAGNPESIVSNFTLEKSMQIVRCVELLEEFFIHQNKSTKYFSNINYLKFSAKKPLLFHRKIRDFNKWRLIFPESNQYIWKYDEAPLNMKLIAWLVFKKMNLFAFILLVIKEKIKLSTL